MQCRTGVNSCRGARVLAAVASLVAMHSAVPGVAWTQGTVTAFVNVSVVPMDRERVLTDQTVVVRGGTIVAMGPTEHTRIPQGATRVDGRGKFLIPGLGDMHVHLGYPLDDTTAVADLLFALLANGVTVVRDMHSGRRVPADDRGRLNIDGAWRLALRQRIAAGELLAPRLYTAGDPDVSSPAAAARSVVELKADGHDFVKVSLERSAAARDVFDSIVHAARRVKLRVVGHVPPDVGVEPVLQAHLASVEHLYEYFEYVLGVGRRWSLGGDYGLCCAPVAVADTAIWMQPGYRFDRAKMHAAALATRRAGVWSCPTLYAGDRFQQVLTAADARASVLQAGDSAAVDLAKRRRAVVRVLGRWVEFNHEMVKALHDVGAGLLLGTDMAFGPVAGFSIHQELASLVQAGLTPYQALETGTRNVAAFLGALDNTGTIAVGKRADLVLLYGNPLEDIGYTAGPAGVMLAGQWLSRATIDARLDAFPVGEGRLQEVYRALREARRDVWQH